MWKWFWKSISHLVLTACCTGSICRRPFRSCPSRCPRCLTSRSRTSLSLQPLMRQKSWWGSPCTEQQPNFFLCHLILLTWPPDVSALALSGLTLSTVAPPLSDGKANERHPFAWGRRCLFCCYRLDSYPYLVHLAEVSVLFMKVWRALWRGKTRVWNMQLTKGRQLQNGMDRFNRFKIHCECGVISEPKCHKILSPGVNKSQRVNEQIQFTVCINVAFTFFYL